MSTCRAYDEDIVMTKAHGRYYSVRQVARMLGRNEATVRRMCERGELIARKTGDTAGSHWRIEREQLAGGGELNEARLRAIIEDSVNKSVREALADALAPLYLTRGTTR